MIGYIYYITNTLTNQVYVGSTKNTKQRFASHKRDLRKNKHHNPILQNSYNKYGSTYFKYIVKEKFEGTYKELLKLESLHISWIPHDKLLNIEIYPHLGPLVEQKRSITSEQAAEIRGLFLSNTYSRVELAKIYKCQSRVITQILTNTYHNDPEYIPTYIPKIRNLFTDQQVKEIRELYCIGYSVSKLSSLYNTTHTTIAEIIKNKRYVDTTYIIPSIRPVTMSGPEIHNSLFSLQKIKEIRQEYIDNPNISYTYLAKIYNCHNTTIIDILSNTTYHDPMYIPPNRPKNSHPGWYDEEFIQELRNFYIKNPKVSFNKISKIFKLGHLTTKNILLNKTYHNSKYSPPK